MNNDIIQEMTQRFNMSDLSLICFNMGWNTEDFPNTLTKRAIAMVEYANSRGELGQLFQVAQKVNPIFKNG